MDALVVDTVSDPIQRRRAYHAAYRAANRDKVRAWARAARLRNLDRRKLSDAKYRAAHTDKMSAYGREYHLRNSERLKPIRAAWRAKNKEKMRPYYRNYDRENAERIAARKKRHKELNPELYRERRRKYVEKNRERLLAKSRAYNQRTKSRRRQYVNERLKSDPMFRIKHAMSARIRGAMKRQNAGAKSKKTIELLGCDVAFFKGYIEARFEPGMSWDNYGEWSLDHRIPCAAFNLLRPEEQSRCFHYSNLRPMWMAENRSKSDKRPPPHQGELL